MAEAASCLDVKSSFFQVSLPRETRHLFRCRVEDGTLVELTRLPVGCKASPEILQIIITSAIAGVTTVAHRLWAAPPLVRVDVWTDNMRIAGPKSDVTLWEAKCFLMRPAVTPRWGGSRSGRYALHLSGGAVWSHSPCGIPE
ncbi:target of rapamycin (TOR) kinase 1 [Trypanosoma cruzi]|nr:target of rapamycin (TOR) kinase 1 [Trypanosoma cruzi]